MAPARHWLNGLGIFLLSAWAFKVRFGSLVGALVTVPVKPNKPPFIFSLTRWVTTLEW